MIRTILIPLLCFGSIANADVQNCGDHEMIVERLVSLYGETRQSVGLVGGHTAVETFANRDTGTWTIAVTSAGGQTCLVLVGNSFQGVSPEGDAL